MTSILPSTKILLVHARPEPGGGRTRVGDEFTGTVANRVNLSPTTRSVGEPAYVTVNVPPRSIVELASTASFVSVAPLLVISMRVLPRNVRLPPTLSGP